MKNQTFGIEIETTGLSRKTVAEIIATYFGTDAYYIGTCYDTYAAADSQGRVWKCMSDSSIVVTGHGVCEIVSPILTYEDMNDLQEIVRLVRRAGAKSSARFRCGIHIHIGAQNHTIQSLKNLVNYMSSYQDVIYKALQVDPYREGYCKKLEPMLIDKFNERGLNSMEKCETAWYGRGFESEKHRHYSSSRYHGLNLHSVFSKGTVEFRLFNGTLHAGEIRSYVVFCLAMSQYALDKKSIRRTRKNQFNDKYTMYEMLCRIGIKGDEFKNCRDHLIKHLTGELTHEGRYVG
jgi:hypothetical protein